ncbi:hypothetical protein Drose_10080 [Dactylosporangium roseum]|uniref:Uncharacterized protein n=1 Tax=Dactylosporangium roseum TaxID=47989 RepID=A0ABY5ZCP0_9ACTN|nr:hypothetical protein [Dactylosporangium roseum]UWZ38547.1 hypothetical protein Drose_10080 [Dactylosporangium roseum]
MTNETRKSLHGLAELVLAGPQYRRSGTIRLRVTPAGFATVAAPDLAVEADALVAGDQRLPLAGRTFAQLATGAGVDAGAPEGVYHDHSGADPGDTVVTRDAAAILAALATGDAALRRLSADAVPVLWPEHFDVGISVDEVNYGVSAGDTAIDEPYVYVGPWRPRQGSFWNVPFGAAVPIRDLGDVNGVFAFFEEGRARATE